MFKGRYMCDSWRTDTHHSRLQLMLQCLLKICKTKRDIPAFHESLPSLGIRFHTGHEPESRVCAERTSMR